MGEAKLNKIYEYFDIHIESLYQLVKFEFLFIWSNLKGFIFLNVDLKGSMNTGHLASVFKLLRMKTDVARITNFLPQHSGYTYRG